MEGKPGEVIVPIPATGYGEVIVRVGPAGVTSQIAASFDGEPIAAGDRVVVVTAAPALLAEALIGPLGHPIEVLGTSLKRRGGGWVADVHCRHQRKCQALAEAGHGARWTYAYTDSLDDLPLLRGADRPVIVKGGKAAERRLFRAGLLNGRAAAW